MILVTENQELIEKRNALLCEHEVDEQAVARIEEAIARNLGIHLSELRERQDEIVAKVKNEPKKRRQNYKDLVILYRQATNLAKEISVFKKKMREVDTK